MQKYFQYHNLIFNVSYDSDSFEAPLASLRSVSLNNSRSIQHSIDIKQTNRKISVPDGALRIFHHNNLGEVYTTKELRIVHKHSFSILINYRQKKASIEYLSVNDEVLWYTEQVIKWLINTLALDQDFVYVPGHAIEFQNSRLLIAGEPDCGKIQLMGHLKDEGARLLGANVLAHRSTPSLLATSVGLSGRNNEAKTLKKIFETLPESINPVNEALHALLFVTQWNYEESLVKIMPNDECIKILSQFNSYHYEFFSDSQQSTLHNSYGHIFSKIPCYFFYMGNNVSQQISGLSLMLNKTDTKSSA